MPANSIHEQNQKQVLSPNSEQNSGQNLGQSPPRSLLGWASGLWGLVGVLYLLSNAILRLSAMVTGALALELSLWHWAVAVVWMAFMGFSEGYRGFQKAFSPRVGARARWLSQYPAPLRSLLAPLFCMGYFGSSRKRKIVSWALTTGIIGIIVLVRMLPQPWRGIIDSGVVLGLTWGALSVLYFGLKALFGSGETADPELSERLKKVGLGKADAAP